jgi:hypothetical protein
VCATLRLKTPPLPTSADLATRAATYVLLTTDEEPELDSMILNPADPGITDIFPRIRAYIYRLIFNADIAHND